RINVEPSDESNYLDLQNVLLANNRIPAALEVAKKATGVAEKAGVKNFGKWAASAAWFDYDRDGFLDLVVTTYARFSFEDVKKCELNGMRTYIEQKMYAGMPLTLYHNNGDGTFTDVSEKSGLAKLIGRALGVIAIDVNDLAGPICSSPGMPHRICC